MLQDLESEAWDYIEKRFGVTYEDLEEFSMQNRSGDIWITTGKREENSETEGFRFLRDTKHGFKPTTYALQFLGEKLNSNTVEVNEEELEVLLDGGMIERVMEEKGYVAIIFEDQVIGCGLYKDELVSSRVPKGRASHLVEYL